MTRPLSGKYLMLRFLSSMIFFATWVGPQPIIHAVEPSVLSAIRGHLDSDEFDSATALLRDVDVEAITRELVEKRQDKFLAVRGYTKYVPGLPRDLADRIVARNDCVLIPGTNDTYDTQSELSYQNAAEDFAISFNQMLRYMRGKRVEASNYAISMDELRQSLELDAETWNRWPLKTRLRVRWLAEENRFLTMERSNGTEVVSGKLPGEPE